MWLTRARRKLLAESLTKAAEYIFALIVLGQFITGKINIPVTLGSILAYVLLIVMAMIVTINEGE